MGERRKGEVWERVGRKKRCEEGRKEGGKGVGK